METHKSRVLLLIFLGFVKPKPPHTLTSLEGWSPVLHLLKAVAWLLALPCFTPGLHSAPWRGSPSPARAASICTGAPLFGPFPECVPLSRVPRDVAMFLRTSLTQARLSTAVGMGEGEGEGWCGKGFSVQSQRPPAHPSPECPLSLTRALGRGLTFSHPCSRVLGTGCRGVRGA